MRLARKFLVLFLFIYFLLFIKISLSTQLSFLLDLDELAFNFSQNMLNDSSLTKDLIFSGVENKTVWVRIPKNSTVLSSSINLAGVMSPIQASPIEEIYGLAVGNVTASPENEIAVAVANYVKLLNNTGGEIWSYPVTGVSVYDVSIGNVSSEEGSEVVAGAGNYYVYLLNSSGSQVWNASIGGEAKGVAAGDVSEAYEWDEIAVAGGDNRVYLFNSSGQQLWNYTGTSSFNSVAIGNLTSDYGNEIVAGSSDYKVYLLNSSGSQIWSSSVGTGINHVAAGDVSEAYEWDEIVAAGNNGTVFLFNSSGSILWSYTTTAGTPASTVAIGDVTTDAGNEIVIGSNDKKVYVLNSSGYLIWSYTTNDWVRGVGVGNLTADPGNEVAAGTRKIGVYNNLYILNFEYYPTNVILDIGNDSTVDWEYSGKFRTTATASNNSAFQEYLSSCSSKSCDVPLVFHSDYGGDLNITSLNITYQYNISNIISYQTVPGWSRTRNVWVNESVGNQTKNITYSENPAVDIRIYYVEVDPSADRCDFNGTAYPVIAVNGKNVCDISSLNHTIPSSGSLGYDKIWDSSMQSSVPVFKNESLPVTEGGFWKKNVTIWNDTLETFYNVTANTTLNDTIVVADSKLKVEWYGNGDFYDITPASTQSNCNSSNPTYSAVQVGSDIFYVCKQDLNGNGVVDLFVWKQPHTSSILYEVSGSSNNPTVLGNLTATPSQAIWGSEFNFTVDVSEAEGDNVTVRLWVYLTNPATWEKKGEKNITGSGTVWFNITSNKTWAGSGKFKFEYADFNSSNGYQYHDWQNTSEEDFTALRHNISVIHTQGNDTQVNRTNSIGLIVRVNDTDLNEFVSGANCSFWVMLNDTHWDTGTLSLSNSSGYCNYTFTPNASYTPGQRWWKAGTYQDVYYIESNSTNFTFNVYGDLNINLTLPNQNFTRLVNALLTAKIYDEFGDTVEIAGYSCTWYVDNIFRATTATNSSGYCNYTWSTSCADSLGSHMINVTLSGSVSPYYFNNKTIDSVNRTLKDNLNITIVSPAADSIYYMGETVYLNSTVLDACYQQPSYSYNVSWAGTGTSDWIPPCSRSGTGDNTTWTLTGCPPELFLIKVNASGEFYNQAEKNVSVWIYGWSGVNITYPEDGQIVYRTQDVRTVDITCFVFDFNFTPNYIESYPLNIWDGSNILTSNKTNSTGYYTYTWNISDNTTVPDGQHVIRCNISDTNVSYYRRYNTSKPNSTVSIIIRETDTAAPSFTGVSANSVTPGGNVSIEANVTDWYGVDKVWVNLTYPNGSSSIFYLNNLTSYTMQTRWRYNLTNLTQTGDYDFVLYANDTSGLTSNHSSWFEVYNTAQFLGSNTNAEGKNVSMVLTFYRPGRSDVVHQYSTNTSSSSYNFEIRKRLYDLEVKVFDHTIKFNSMNTSNVTEVVNPLNITNISVALVEPPEAYRHKLKAVEIKANFSYSNATITLNYSDSYGIIDYEPAVRVYRCSNWVYPSTCASGWAALDSSVNTSLHTVSVNSTSASVYIAVEKSVCGNGLADPGETCSNCPQDIGACPSGGISQGPGGGGGPAGISPVCGNKVCEAGENRENCPQDCGGLYFSIRTNLTEAELELGEKRFYAIWLTNNLNKKINVTIAATGSASKFISLAESFVALDSNEEKIIKLSASSSTDDEPGTYIGQIAVTGEGRTESLPVKLIISPKGAINLDVVVNALTKTVSPNETLRLHVTLYNLGIRKKLDVNLSYVLKDLKTDGVVLYLEEFKKIDASESFIKNIPVGNISLGSYSITVNAKYDGRTASSTDTITVVKPFWTLERIRLAGLIAVMVAAAIASYYGRGAYMKWKLSKARYIFPVNFAKLPKGKMWIGKIAETDRRAEFSMDDLTTHVLVAGATGSGKSVTGNIFVEELLEQKIPVVVFDPTAQWTGFVRPCEDEKVLKYYKSFGLSKRDTKPFKGMLYEVTSPDVKIDFKKYMNPGEITVFTLNKLKPGEYDTAVTNIVNTIFAQSWEESTSLKLVVVFDEVHRLLERYGGKGGYVALERACREFRKWGIGLIMISQVLSDFKEAIKGNVLTEVQMHTKSLEDLGRVEKKYGLEYAKRVAREEVGVGMVQNPAYNEGRPWFISFRPPLHSPHKIPERDMELYKEYSAVVEMLESTIAELEKKGKDTFSYKVELKLLKDKLKEGRFRMAKIYIDSLKEKLK